MKIPFLSFFSRKSAGATRSRFGNAYEAARVTETRPAVRSGSPDDAAAKLPEWTHKSLVENCRYAADNFGVAKEIVTANQIYAIGDGLRAQPRSASPEWNQKAKTYWKRFERKATLAGESLRSLCLYNCRAFDTDGEMFNILTKDASGFPTVQVVETHRLLYKTDGAIIDGIEWDAQGLPVAYLFSVGDTQQRVPASSVVAFRNRQRPSETRCAPALQHAIPHLKDAFLLLEMEKKCAAAQTNFAYAVTTPNPETAEEEIDGFRYVRSELEADAGNAPATPVISELSKLDGGKMLKIKEGLKLDILESRRPSQAFLGFHEALMRDSTLGVSSYEIAVDSSKIGGASVRLQTAKMERRIAARQQDLIEQLLTPLWRYVIGTAITQGKLEAVENWTEVEFSTPRRLTVDAGRESASLLAEVREGTRPIEDLFDAMGYGDFEEELHRRAQLTAKVRDVAEQYDINPEALAPLLFKKEI